MAHIEVDRHDGVGVITINRPARFNALDVRTAQDFRRAGLQLARDDRVRAVVLRGHPGMFCSGADLKFIRNGGEPAEVTYLQGSQRGEASNRAAAATFGECFKQILEYIHSTISEIRRAPKPFIAAVDGIAAAGGLGIALCCDLVFASERASFEWAYAKTGLTGAESSTFMLPRLVGLRRAMELVLLNPRVTAQQALEYGLITRVLPVDGFDEAVMRIAQTIAAGPSHAFAIAKELLNDAAGMDRLDGHLDRELAELSRVADGPEFAAGIAAFFAKATPSFPLGQAQAPQAGDQPRPSETGAGQIRD
jgi:2-(1,2-epoxy-1,2-dihydrophenyl)acetyl-CoA isomerase